MNLAQSSERFRPAAARGRRGNIPLRPSILFGPKLERLSSGEAGRIDFASAGASSAGPVTGEVEDFFYSRGCGKRWTFLYRGSLP